MSQAIPNAGCCADECSCACTETTYVQVPGPAGADGAAGAAGAAGSDGENAFTETTAQFVMPAIGATVGVFVDSSAWMFVGQIVQVEGAGGFEVTAVPTGVTATLENLGWSINAAPAAVIATSAMVTPSGPAGAAGAAGAPTGASYITRVAEAGLSSESALGPLASGYVKSTTTTGAVSTVAAVPLSEIDTTGYAAGNVLVANGANRATVSPVSDEFLEYNAVTPAAFSIDWSLERTFEKTLTAGAGADTFTFANLVTKKTITVFLKQNATGNRTVNWPAGIYWSGGAPIAMTTTADAYQVFAFYYNGTHTIASIVPDCHP